MKNPMNAWGVCGCSATPPSGVTGPVSRSACWSSSRRRGGPPAQLKQLQAYDKFRNDFVSSVSHAYGPRCTSFSSAAQLFLAARPRQQHGQFRFLLEIVGNAETACAG